MIAIPLLEGDPDVPLDLQAAFDRAYDFGPYFKEVAYGEDAVIPPLTADQAAWAAALLGQAGYVGLSKRATARNDV